jgi:hypothetical protein
MALVRVLQRPENLLCTAWEEGSRRLEAPSATAVGDIHSRVPKLRTTRPACLHMLSTDLCTAWIDGGPDSLETVTGVR